MIRLILHNVFLVLLTFAGTASGMVLCIGQDGHIAIEAHDQDNCCTVESYTAGVAISVERDHQCCIDVPLPETRSAVVAPTSTNEHPPSLNPLHVLSQFGVSESRCEVASRVSTVHANCPLPTAPSVGTTILLI